MMSEAGLGGRLGSVLLNTERVKLREWSRKYTRDSRTLKIPGFQCLPKKSAGRGQSQPRRETIGAARSKIIGARFARLFGAHNSLTLSWVLGMELQDVTCALLSFDWLWSHSFLYSCFSVLKWKWLPCAIECWKQLNLLKFFTWAHNCEFTLNLGFTFYLNFSAI